MLINRVNNLTCCFVFRLQNEISQAYGERRQIRDDLLHVEMMQKQSMFTVMRKQQALDTLDLVSSTSHRAGTKVGRMVSIEVFIYC